MNTHKDLTSDELGVLYNFEDEFIGPPSVLVMIERYLRGKNNVTKPKNLISLLKDQGFSRNQRIAGVEEYRIKHTNLDKTTEDFLKRIAGETIEQSGAEISTPPDIEDLLDSDDTTPLEVEAALKSFKAYLTKSIAAMEPKTAKVLLPILSDEIKPEDSLVLANQIRYTELDKNFYPILKNLFDFKRLQIISPSDEDILLARLKALWLALQVIIDFNLQQISKESNQFDDVLRKLSTDGEFTKEQAISFWTNAGSNSEKFKEHLDVIEESAYDYKKAARKARENSPLFAKNQWSQIERTEYDKGHAIYIGVDKFLKYKK